MPSPGPSSWRAVAACLALPGTVAFLVPWLLRPAGVQLRPAGWALGSGAPRPWGYAGAVAVAFHLRVVLGEEPWLARRHGARWAAYQAAVPRWPIPSRASRANRRAPRA